MNTNAVVRLFYNTIPRWAPPSTAGRIGRLSAQLRLAAARRVLKECGKNVNIERDAVLSPDVAIGDRSGLGRRSRAIGPVTIGRDVMMGPDVLILTRNHKFEDVSRPMRDQGYGPERPVRIGDDVWIGARATILPGVNVGRGAIIGACSVVTSDVEPFSVVAGNPARQIRSRVPRDSGRR